MGGIGHGVAVATLITFINTVYARPWQQDASALLLPGIVGGLIGYAVGSKIRQAKRLYWVAMTIGALLSLALSFIYNEVLLREPMKSEMYEVYLYVCFALMNMAAFSVFGILGWTLGAGNGESRDAE